MSTFVKDADQPPIPSDSITDNIQDFANQQNSKQKIDGPAKSETWIGSLSLWSNLKRDLIVAEVQQAERFYMQNPDATGTLEERRKRLDEAVRKIFSQFVQARQGEYSAVKCRVRGIDWNTNGSSWNSIYSPAQMRFREPIVERTTNGDWKAGPVWENEMTKMSWKTGGHGRSETFCVVDAYYDSNLVWIELDSARAALASLGIPTPDING